MLHCLQQTQNLTPQQQNVLQQLTHQFKLMQQHQQQLRNMQQQAQLRAAGTPVRPGQPQQFPQTQGNFPQQIHPGNRTPQGGTTAQTGFVNDGSFSPATGHTQQTAGMPFKSAGGFQPQPISSTTNNQELSKCPDDFDSSCQYFVSARAVTMASDTSIILTKNLEKLLEVPPLSPCAGSVEVFKHSKIFQRLAGAGTVADGSGDLHGAGTLS